MADEEYDADDAGAEYDDIAEEDDNIEETEEQEEDGCVLLILLGFVQIAPRTWRSGFPSKFEVIIFPNGGQAWTT